ncbi:replication protein [Paenibacillus sp. SI8]|uniref:replication protein n=1 Tax=unclassified Paenibacillus TaxID=185978 RepID=UPI003466585B
MADVQLENGYTAIANVVLEQLYQTKLNATQHRIVLVVLRFTYGFKRKYHAFSMGFLSQAVDGDRRQVQRELKRLLDRKIIMESEPESTVRVLGFNKNYEEWLGESTSGKSTMDGEYTSGGFTTGEKAISGEITTGGSGGFTISGSGESTTQEINLLKQSFKENITTTTEPVSESSNLDYQKRKIHLIDSFCELHGKIATQLRQSDYKSVDVVLSKIPDLEFIVSAMKTKFEEKKKREEEEGLGFRPPHTFKYYEDSLQDAWQTHLAKQAGPSNVVPLDRESGTGKRPGKSGKPQIPIAKNDPSSGRLSDEEMKEALATAKRLDKKFGNI